MRLIDLFEGNRPSAISSLEKYLGDPSVYVTFVDVEKIGINPQTLYRETPIGIYAYPVDHAVEAMKERKVKFAGHRDYIGVLRSVGEMLDLSTYSWDDLDADIERLTALWRLIDSDKEKALVMLRRREDTAAQTIWLMTRQIASFKKVRQGRNRVVAWNGIFRAIGYSGVVDHGDGIIHDWEPHQAVFFSKQGCRTLEFLINDHLRRD